MQALVLIGGFGTRLRPLTYRVPKAMVPVANIPFLDRFVDYLQQNGVTHIVFAMGYLPDPIAEHLKKRCTGVEYAFVVEDHPLDTGGAIKNAEGLLGDRFFVFNGDILTTIPLKDLLKVHEEKGALVTIALTPVDDPSRYGVVVTESDGRVKAFIEKPPKETAPSNYINAGIYLYEREVLQFIPAGQPYSVERGLYPKLLEIGLPFYAAVFPNDYWLDIGKIEHYLQANFDVLSGKAPLPVPGQEIQPSVWVQEGAQIAPTASLHPPVLIGKRCVIKDNAVIGPFAVLGDDTIVAEQAVVRESVLWERCVVGAQAVIQKCVLGSECEVAEGIEVTPNSAYGCGEHIG